MSEQSDLFQADSGTSQEAAELIDAGILRDVVWAAIAIRGVLGATEEEVSTIEDMPGSTTRPRIVELLDRGRIVRSNLKRGTASGRRAFVYVDASLLCAEDRRLMTGQAK